MTWEWPDAERLLIAWAKGHATIGPLIDGRAATKLPDPPNTTAWPWLTIKLIDGGVGLSEIPMEEAWVQFDAWALDWATARILSTTVVRALHELNNDTVPNEGHLFDANILTRRHMDEEDTKYARFMVEAIVGLRPTSLASD